MTLFANDFETGVNTAVPTTSDTGSPNQFSAVTVGASSAITYDNTHVAHGSMAVKLQSAASTLNQIQASTGTIAEEWGRFYVYISSQTGQIYLAENYQSGGARNNIQLNTSGKILLVNNGAGNTAGGVTVSLNAWIRLEYHWLYNSSTGTLEVKLFTSADSITAAETINVASGNTQTNSDHFAIGTRAGGGTPTAWYDNWVAGCTAYPGPFPVNTVAPTISGSAPVGSVLTAGNGTWNSGGTFNYTYQWTTGGSNIGGATASTYTTVSGDIGNAIGCKVTATGVQATNENATQASSNTITPTGGIFLPGLSGLHRPAVIRAATR